MASDSIGSDHSAMSVSDEFDDSILDTDDNLEKKIDSSLNKATIKRKESELDKLKRRLQIANQLIQMMKPFIIQEKQETVDIWNNKFNNDEGKFELYDLVVITSVSMLDIYI